ncbi:MAG: O-acetylhomoserine sulfhydrylase (EC / O-succinylhomoserine sulfhydrylase (EC [uncultured Sulfurovum sp.]|uniref:O-acetylhomoserine sulfhydrylase ) n=1 Tax=uncultured Sulfurovum sp. TaxID=269237 RepID=A0A6S6THB4_9BACT|nr:MAG: O-acetylhomoserine sulfhydrylase (EC / O-succinylhomoserine sulfhydrylase (EC [uncultured Sulfurovum sp.]
MKDFNYFNTLLVQSVGSKVRAIAPSITSSAAFGYENAEEAESIFKGEIANPLYARVGNPTTTKLESIIAKMEGGLASIATSSGMGAMAMVMTAYLKSEDEVLCIGGFFGGTYTLVNETMKRFGIKSSFCDIDDFEQIEETLKKGIHMVLIESVGNPSLELPDLPKIIKLCNKYETLLVVDNTVTPLTLRPLEMGADIVIHSTTKAISGHSAALGGVAVFRAINTKDKLHNDKYKELHPIINKMKKKAMVAIAKKRGMRDIGMSANAHGSFLTMLGLETLALRLQRVNDSLPKIVKILEKNLPKHIKVSHPSLKSNPYHKRFVSDFNYACGPIITLECSNKSTAFKLLNKLEIVTQTANIGDNRTLALHMASTIYRDFDEDTQKYLGVTEGLIRISIGLEDPETIAKDFLQAINHGNSSLNPKEENSVN